MRIRESDQLKTVFEQEINQNLPDPSFQKLIE